LSSGFESVQSYRIWADPAARIKAPLLRLVSPHPPGVAARDRLTKKPAAIRSISTLCGTARSPCDVERPLASLAHNGAGKSTLLQLIAGTMTPTSGAVDVHRPGRGAAERARASIPISPGGECFSHGSISSLEREIRSRFDEIAEFADIRGLHSSAVAHLFQRHGHAAGIRHYPSCVDPQVLIVDEALAVGETISSTSASPTQRTEGSRKSPSSSQSTPRPSSPVLQPRPVADKGSTVMVGDAEAVVSHYNQLVRERQSADVQRHSEPTPAARPARRSPLILFPPGRVHGGS